MANSNEQSTNEITSKSEVFFQKNGKAILIAAIAVVLIIAGYFCYKSFISAPREEKASTAIARGQDYFNSEQFDKALNGDGAGYPGFIKIASDYSSTKAGNLANLYAGLCYAQLDKLSLIHI